MKERYFSKHQCGGVGIKASGAFCDLGKVILPTIEGRMDSKIYKELLGTALFPVTRHIYKGELVFQQDSASVHVSKYTTEPAWSLRYRNMQRISGSFTMSLS